MSAPFSFTTPRLSQVMEIIYGERFKGYQPVKEVILRSVKFPNIKAKELWQQKLVTQIKYTQYAGVDFHADGRTVDFVFYPEDYGTKLQSKAIALELWLNFIFEKNPAVAGITFKGKITRRGDYWGQVILDLKSTLKLPDISATAKALAQEALKKGNRSRYHFSWDPSWGE